MKDRLDADRQSEKDRLEHEVKLRELDVSRSLEAARAERDATDSKSRTTGLKTSKGPKLPYFDQDKDNMDSYLARFERYAEANAWLKGQWSIHLSSLLRGKALDVYSRCR